MLDTTRGSSLNVSGKNGVASQFWTSAQSSSQGAFASASSASLLDSSNKNVISTEEAETAIKQLAEQGAVALALASPHAGHRAALGVGKSTQ
jgi:hypothetical protein|tara:strand:- start:25 stop:300 length:276 start_codon:yes stop_codon:yes gene_type:complete